MKGARGVLINVTSGPDVMMTLFEIDEAVNRVKSEVDADAQIIFGATCDNTLEGAIRVSVVATGIESQSAVEPIHYGDNVIVHEKLRSASQHRGFTGNSVAVGAMVGATGGYTPYAAPTPAMMSARPHSDAPTQAPAYGTVGNTAIAPQPATQPEPPQRMAEPQQRSNAQQPQSSQTNRLPPVNRGGLMQEGMTRPAAPSAALQRQPAAGQAATPLQAPISADRPFIAPQPMEVPRQPELAADIAPVQIDPFRQADLENAGRSPASRAHTPSVVQRQASAASQHTAKPSGWGNLLQRMTNLGGSRASAQTGAHETGEPQLRQPAEPVVHRQTAASQGLPAATAQRIVPVGQEDDLEIPTFLRRQAN